MQLSKARKEIRRELLCEWSVRYLDRYGKTVNHTYKIRKLCSSEEKAKRHIDKLKANKSTVNVSYVINRKEIEVAYLAM